MNVSGVIDTLCGYFNTVSSVLATIQRIKNEYHADKVDYTTVILNLLRQPTVVPPSLGQPIDSLQDDPWLSEHVVLAALISHAVYAPTLLEDWTEGLTDVLRIHGNASKGDPWRRGKLRPSVINLYESHYMTSTKSRVFTAIHKPTNAMVISLPGTNSRSDWIPNLHSATVDLELSDGSRAKVHQGFLYIAECLNSHPLLIAFLTDGLRAGFTTLLLCGHSQAGAVVSILSILLKRRYKLITKVITFGSAACFQSSRCDVERAISFARCVEHSDRMVMETWQIDPVPLLDDTMTSQDSSSSLSPMGTTYMLLEQSNSVSVRQLAKGELKSLFRNVLMNFSPDPHSMQGYLRNVLSCTVVPSRTATLHNDASESTSPGALEEEVNDSRAAELQLR